ncbi:hypothetical protein F2Q68_00016812 [Brassica cretica]|uniref:Uncharacterized protein n=1 Tax=Brassica cretica TaxID=69181 RepID=A0A8S9HNE7_BRACR|nr:hypothetical protein F2Q68_00016812 [Brassica cretica]
MTPKPNQKSKVSTNKRGREIEQESPSSPPPAPKKRVDMISWGPSNNATNETKSQTEGKIRFEISVAIRTLENPDEATPPPRVTQYNPNTKPPCVKIYNFKRKNKMTKIRELLEKPIQKKDRMQTLNRNLSGESNVPRSIKEYIEPPKCRSVRNSGDPKRSIWTLHGRKLTTTTAAGHDPPKLKLQWVRQN